MSIDVVGSNGSSSQKSTPESTPIPLEAVAPPANTPSQCPYLGLSDDSETKTLFPSNNNYCYRAEPAAGIQLFHQQSHCLSQSHIHCPVYQGEAGRKLPADIHRRSGEGVPRQNQGAISRRAIGILGLVGAVALFIWWLSLGGDSPATPLPPQPTITPTTVADSDEAADSFESDDSSESGDSDELDDSTESAVVPPPLPTDPPPTATAAPPTATATTEPTATATTEPSPTVTVVSPTETPTAEPTATPVTAVAGTINQGLVIVRTGPDASYGFIANLGEEGTEVELIGQNSNGDWWQICCVDGETGWVLGAFVTLPDGIDAADLPVVQPPTLARVEVERLNIRSQPDIAADVLNVSDFTTLLEVISRLPDDSWLEVSCCEGAIIGWVFGESVSIQGQLSDVPINEVP